MVAGTTEQNRVSGCRLPRMEGSDVDNRKLSQAAKVTTISICGKCAHESAAALKPVSPRTEKTVCEICGRKRFCVVHEVQEGE